MSNTLNESVVDPATRELLQGRSFWNLLWKSFISSISRRVAVGWLLALALMAILVPFVANGRPFWIETLQASGAWQREYPLFSGLQTLDWLLLWLGGIALAAWAGWRWKRGALKAVGLIALSLALAGALALGLQHQNLNDPRDFRGLLESHSARNAVFAPIPWGYADQEPLVLDRVYEFPTLRHPLGTDGNGRDALARLLWSSRVVLGIGLISQVIALSLGIFFGALLGFFVGWVDLLGMRLLEIVEAVPTFFLIITFVAIYGRDIAMIMVILGLTGWTGVARFVRAEFLRLRKLDYVIAAVAVGLPLRRVLFRHMLPNGLTPVIVTATFGIAGAVGSESVLSFLNLGVEPPMPSWGSMLNEAGNPAETFRWWLAIAPGMLIFLTILALFVIGEGLRDAMDPLEH